MAGNDTQAMLRLSLTMQSTRRRNWLFAQTGQYCRRGLLRRCRGRFAPATTGRRMTSAACLALRAAQPADEADSGRKSLRLSRPSRLIRRPVGQLSNDHLSSHIPSQILRPRSVRGAMARSARISCARWLLRQWGRAIRFRVRLCAGRWFGCFVAWLYSRRSCSSGRRFSCASCRSFSSRLWSAHRWLQMTASFCCSLAVSPAPTFGHLGLSCKQLPNPAVHLAPFGRWTLRDEAAQRRSPLR